MSVVYSKALRIFYLFSLAVVLSACGGGSSSSSSSETVSISGAIFVAPNSDIDQDVESRSATFVQENNLLANAQRISNPSVVGGYVSGRAGVYTASGDRNVVIDFRSDPQDFYEVSLLEGQRVTMSVFFADGTVEETNNINALVDIDVQVYLRLKSSPFTVIESLEFDTQSVQSFTVPESNDYYLEVRAAAGVVDRSDPVLYSFSISQYLLTEQQANTSVSLVDFKPGEVVVKFKKPKGLAALSKSALADKLNSKGLKVIRETVGRAGLYQLGSKESFGGASLSEEEKASPAHQKWQTWQTIQKLKLDSDVEYAEPNYLYRAMAGATEPEFTEQWSLPMIGLPAAWDLATGSGVTVAVIDSGIDRDHVDLVANILQSDGYDFISDSRSAGDGGGLDPNPEDVSESFHGTHVAGIIAANGRNNEGISGVAFDANIMPLRVLGIFDEATSFDIAQAVLYAAGLNNISGELPSVTADVINLSLGGPGFSSIMNDAIQAAIARGVIVVAAAGNENASALVFPAAYEGVVSVSSVDEDESRSSFSNFGDFIDVAAPGGFNNDFNPFGLEGPGVLSTIGDNEYLRQLGTSMASPHVAGVAALMKSYDSAVNHSVFNLALTGGDLTDDLGAPGYDTTYGHGLINASKALAWLEDGISDQLNILPSSLGFVGTNTSLELALANPGEQELAVISITPDEDWITVTELSSDFNNLRYRVEIDREQVGLTVASGNLDIVYTLGLGPQQLETVRVSTAPNLDSDDTVGELFVFLIDEQDESQIFENSIVEAEPQGDGSYRFSFDEVPAGSYYLLASTNNDFDGLFLDSGEAGGGYPSSSRREVVVVEGEAQSGLDFQVEFESLFQSLDVPSSDGNQPVSSPLPAMNPVVIPSSMQR